MFLLFFLFCIFYAGCADGYKISQSTVKWRYNLPVDHANNLPDFIILKVRVNRQIVSFYLNKNVENVEDSTVEIIKQRPKIHHGREHYSMYTDDSMEASFSVAVDTDGVFYYGTFQINNTAYSLLPFNEINTKKDSELMIRNKVEINETIHAIVVEKLSPSSSGHDDVEPKNRGKSLITKLDDEINKRMFPKDVKRNLTVEVYLVLDYSIFAKWNKLMNNDTNETVRHMVYYYLNIFTGIKQRYESINISEFRITAALAGFYIPKDQDSAPFPEIAKDTGSLKVSNFVLDVFLLWAMQYKNFPKHDVIALITGAPESSTKGIAFIKTACTTAGISVSRDSGPFQTADTLTHEIGHNLGAFHDGHDNNCSSEEVYIMTPSRSLTKLNLKDEYLFSSCSIEYFKEYVDILDKNGSNCLVDIATTDLSVRSRKLKYPGQIYNIDQQCQLVYGQESRFCVGVVDENKMCAGISCLLPEYYRCDMLESIRPADGTSCGNKKWCVSGICVHSEYAPTFKDHCMYGDNKLITLMDKTCPEMAADSPNYCYEKQYFDYCCESCEKIRSNDTGCEFGDKNTIMCTSDSLEWICNSPEYRDTCCRSCKNLNSI